ncbi:MAG: 2-C-methyl-D-erythritol 2,4-cyclodiphosphate synthase [Candidatus Brocadiae bacterium]|nr:2-C-methyl-D-erythritol 2,4-cyclodiphosphate synthase [Candidatus Brocadiia bacterium]
MRVGIGYDLHRLGAERPLKLGGIEFPGQPGLIGHSDADPVMHAVADAILGAAALGDIGDHFPDTDPDWKDADSAYILVEAARLALANRSLAPVNVDVNVIAERPRLGDKKDAMRACLAEVLSLPVESVSVKARTAEGLGPVGRGEAIEVQAVVMMRNATRTSDQ